MPINKLSHEFKVGLLIALGLAVALIAVLSVGERQGLLKQRYFLNARFDDVSGLQEGAPVRVSGFQVGVVNRIALVEIGGRQKVEARLRIEKQAQSRIRRGSVAKISSQGLLGDKLVEIVPAPMDQPMLNNGEELITIVVMPPEEILARAAEIADTMRSTALSLNVIMKKVERGTGTLGKMVDDPRLYVNLDSALVSLNHLILLIKGSKGTVGKLINDPSLYNNANQAMTNLNVISDSLKRGQGSLGKMLREPELYNALDSTSQRLNVILGRMEKGEGNLGKLSKDEELYKNLKESSEELNKLIKDIKKDPKRYFSIF
ncbi:MCE family protein [candidate division TA06 bacterium]|uniref:MCE family protein n=1 Tax=candidate division TA06 bacterium TaxID=2250710 RepID=A0A933I9W5_UNCT6|nr:MCE family protein [candidate division TA06 bacterium]